MWVPRCLFALLLISAVDLGAGKPGGKVLPRDMMPGHEGGTVGKKKEVPLGRHYRHVQQPNNLEDVYKLPDENFDNEIGPFESNRLVLGDPDTTILQRRTGRVDEPRRRVPRMVVRTRFEYGEESRRQLKPGSLHYSAGSWALQNVRRQGVVHREQPFRRYDSFR